MSAMPAKDFRAHAEFHARESPSGIGAAVIHSTSENGEHVWECIVSDGRERHYVRVVGVDLPPFPSISTEQVEQGSSASPRRCPHATGSATCSTPILCTYAPTGR